MKTQEYRKKLSGIREEWFEENQQDQSRADTAIQYFVETYGFEDGVKKLSHLINFEASTECAEWMGSLNHKGYGWYGVSLPTTPVTAKIVKAHRLMFALFYGFDALPAGVDGKYNDGSLSVLDHICENTSCVNPLHLEATDGSYNSRKSALKRWATA